VDRDREKDMKKKITFLTLSALLFALSVSAADAQQAGKIPRIGFLDQSTASGTAVLVDPFQELNKLGWIGERISPLSTGLPIHIHCRKAD
jgi:hypothetical protein